MFNWISDRQSRAAHCDPSRDSTDIDMEKSNEEEIQPLRCAELIKGDVYWQSYVRAMGKKGSPLKVFIRMIPILFF